MKHVKGMNTGLTRETLEELGITRVTENGRVFVGSRELKHTMTVKTRKYGFIGKYYNETISIKKRKFTVGRLMCAWFYGYVPSGMHCDHIDRNTLNNNLANLRIVTPKVNNANRTYSQSFISSSAFIFRKLERDYQNANTN